MHNENWDDLRYVLAVGRAGSLNAAARTLGVNHATVLRRVRAFEDRWDRQIFHKSQTGYDLDPNIKEILDIIQEMEDSAAKTQRILTSKATEISGLVRLTSTDSLCQIVLPRIIKSLQEQHAGIQIELRATNQHVNMFLPEADLTIRPAKSAPNDLHARQAGRMHFEIYATRDYWAQNEEKPYKNHNWIGVSDTLAQSPVGIWMSDTIPAKSIKFRTDSFLVMGEMASIGCGVSFLPKFVAEQHVDLITNPKMDMKLRTNIWVAGHEDLERNPHIKTCARFLTTALNATVI